jgi:hypothetical protein
MAFCGVRPEVLGNKDGTNGLILGDLPDLDADLLTFRNIPAQLIVRRELSKVRHQYFSFLNEKASEYLLTYLQERKRNGEKIGLQSPVIRADEGQKIAYLRSRGKNPENFFICTANVESEVRRAIRRAGYHWRPYVLRSFFDSHLLTAELQGRMTSTARAFFMGHKGDIERKYTLNKRQLPRELFHMMKDQYLKGSAFLATEQLTVKEVEQKIESVRADLRLNVQAEVSDELRELREKLEFVMSWLSVPGLKPSRESMEELFAWSRSNERKELDDELRKAGLLAET